MMLPPPGVLQVYRGYSEADVALLQRHAAPDLAPVPGYIVDFLGARTSVVYLHADKLSGHVEGLPVPANWHAEAPEWIGLVKSLDGARDRFVMMELGAGWGPWVVSGAVAAARRGIADVRLCAVEGDPTHYRCMVEHFEANGLDPAQHMILEAAVGVREGTARWPRVPDPLGDWGSRPQLDGQRDRSRRAQF